MELIPGLGIIDLEQRGPDRSHFVTINPGIPQRNEIRIYSVCACLAERVKLYFCNYNG